MNATFPFGLEAPVTFYLTLYVLTLVLHVIFMAYVLAGSLYIAWATVFRGADDAPRSRQPIAALLREWMPFMLSGAITAAVAPLLFIQVIYRRAFYTSNLLLGWRWLVVIPVLIVAFYLLYVLKSRAVAKWPIAARGGLVVSAAGCFVFVAFCWTTNHLLSIQSEMWPTTWETGQVVASVPLLSLRLLTWIAGVFPVMSLLVGWQLWGTADSAAAAASEFNNDAATLANMSLGGTVLAIVCGAAYANQLPETVRSALTGSAGMLWLVGLGAGLLVQTTGWLWQRRSQLRTRRLVVLSLGTVLTLVATACLREIVRIAQAEIPEITANCTAAAQIGGFALFAAATLLNIALITVCMKLVGRGRRTVNAEHDSAAVATAD